tara:strand:+ start:404 stop:1186 length:783 start_codon:yes stop_codon:yes gene_type:complete
MPERYFLYIDILGFRELMKTPDRVEELYRRIARLNVHTDDDFTAILFSDTLLVYAHEIWNGAPSQALMWLIEFSQNLHYELFSQDIYFRSFITYGEFKHEQKGSIEYYYGDALLRCYDVEKDLKCAGTFLDRKLETYCDIFHFTPYTKDASFVHVMQTLDDVSLPHEFYPISGEHLEMTGMEPWVAYMFYYMRNIWQNSQSLSLPEHVRQKFQNTWLCLSAKHAGLCRALVEADFIFENVVELDWAQEFAKIGTEDGAWE